jgi:hypothetical protein
MVRPPRAAAPLPADRSTTKPNSLCNLCRPTETYVHVGFDRTESRS